jgi:organic radical activating enzyme
LADFDDTHFAHRYLQPMDNAMRQENTRACIQACLTDPRWRLSLQTHKITGIR